MRQWYSYEKKKRIEKREAQKDNKDEAFDIAEKDLQDTFERIIKKAELLLRLNVP